MIKVVGRLPTADEYRRVRHLILNSEVEGLTDDDLARVIPSCMHLETIQTTGIPDTTDRTLVSLATTAPHLHAIDISGCTQITDIGVLELTTKSLPLQSVQLCGVIGLTDPSISAIAKSCGRLVELDISGLPLLSPLAVRDVWSFSRKLRTLRLAQCPLLTDKAFPSSLSGDGDGVEDELDENGEKPLPHRPVTWLDELPPLILRHTAENLRVLDVSYTQITDQVVEGVVAHAPKIQTLNLAGCSALSDRALESIALLGENLDVLLLSHVSNITDRGLVQVTRACVNLRCVDVAFCRNLTDMSVFELAGLQSLRRLSLLRVHKLTDMGVFALAEHAEGLERIHISYCDKVSLASIHLLLKRLNRLEHLSATGLPALKRKGVKRFSDPPPANYTPEQEAAYHVFNGDNITALWGYLDKEEMRLRDAEAKNIPFVSRSDDKLDLF